MPEYHLGVVGLGVVVLAGLGRMCRRNLGNREQPILIVATSLPGLTRTQALSWSEVVSRIRTASPLGNVPTILPFGTVLTFNGVPVGSATMQRPSDAGVSPGGRGPGGGGVGWSGLDVPSQFR